MTAYDAIGHGYARYRRPEPRIAGAIDAALGEAHRVVNVGAGTGSYEPRERDVVAVEPSSVMAAQRPVGSAPVVRAVAESLPFASDSFDAAMAILTVHHWPEPRRGLGELCRVAPRRVVLTFDQSVHETFWLVTEYVPAARRTTANTMTVAAVADALGATRIEVVPVPHDCADGFGWAYWRRPERYLDPDARASISMLAALDAADVEPGMERLAADLASGAWQDRHADLLARTEIDGGFRLVVAD